MSEALQVNNILDFLVRSNSLIKRFQDVRLLGLTEIEAKAACSQAQIPYQIFYEEEAYHAEEQPCVAKILIEEDKCIGSKMST